MNDDQMWRPPDGAKMVTVGQMFDLAKRLRSKAYEGIAQELDELFGFDSQLTSNETRTR